MIKYQNVHCQLLLKILGISPFKVCLQAYQDIWWESWRNITSIKREEV